MIRSNLTATQRARHKTALYAVWADMLKRARKEYNMFQKYKIPRDFPVDLSFREFAGFMLWARLEQGYVIGRDDAKQICRVDLSRDWSPENCRWASDLGQRLNTRQYRHTYKNIRLKAVKMRALLEQIPDDAVVTIIFRQDVLPAGPIQQDDFSAVPEAQRVDAKRSK